MSERISVSVSVNALERHLVRTLCVRVNFTGGTHRNTLYDNRAYNWGRILP